MKKNYFYKISLVCAVFFALITAAAAQTGTGICVTSMSNTQHSITCSKAGSLPASGIYNLTIKYLDLNLLADVTLTSTNASVSSTSTQLDITDISLNFPTLPIEGFVFSPDTKGYVQLSNVTGTYYWIWDHNQFTCGPLPLTLLSFTTQLSSNSLNGTVAINWSATNEQSINGYYPQKSSDAVNWTDIALVPAFNDMNLHNYSYTHCTPNKNRTYYRLKINDNGTFRYSDVRVINCSACKGTPPSINCNLVSISGPATVCSSQTFTLNGVSNCSYATWSLSPSGTGSIANISNLQAVVSRVGSEGIATISATIPGCANTFTKTVTIGNSYSITGTISTSSSSKPLQTFNLVPVGNIYTSYYWPGVTNITAALGNGSPSGTGFYSGFNNFSFNIAASQVVYVNITATGACGDLLTATRTFAQSGFAFAITASPNPANSNINVSISKIFDTASLSNAQQLNLSSSNAGLTKMYLYDFYTNNMVKQWTYREKESTSYNLNIVGVKSGVYLLRMERDNKSTITKIIIQQ